MNFEELEKDFEKMRNEWEDIPLKLSDVTASFDTMFTEWNQLKQKECKIGAQDIFSNIGIEEKEAYHCSMLRWLLTPSGHHELGCRFLKLFFKEVLELDLNDEECKLAIVKNEVKYDNSRHDIVIFLPKFLISIEAKINASEQPDQIARIYNDAKRSEKDCLFIFLTKDKRLPSSGPYEVINQFQPASYMQVLKSLNTTVNCVYKNEPVPPEKLGRMSVLNYIRTLEEVFS